MINTWLLYQHDCEAQGITGSKVLKRRKFQVFPENTSSYDFGLETPCEPESVSNFAKVFLPVLYFLVFILGFVGNGLVVCVVLKYLHRSNLTDLCLLNLAVSDLLFLLTLPLYAHYSAVSHWVFGDFMCHISGGLHNVGFYSSTFFMVAMTLDRYVLIQHVQKASKYRSMKTGMVMTTCVWALSFCISLPAFIFTQVVITSERVTCEQSPEDRTWIKYNIFSINILGLVLPVTVMVVCYSRIIPTLMKIRSTQKRRIVKLIICIMVAFFLFWAPYNITLFLDFLRFEDTLIDSCELDTNLILSTTVTETLAFSHCCLNPIIYAFAGQKFMKRSLMMLRKLRSWTHTSRDRSDSSFRMSSVVSQTSVTVL
ncbi:C-C chemokine receptor type 5-like [Periophthalmus magnuspinnatus]|uniref:C-C chemokine receptor type 5-like n=1 Tax=Periophthalmus magnuspinnatus TaxID=409849 RepID=UPI00145A747F|nr:C-C chemokine receptor type 5-like [Periophthalmus magnuspinnatus]